jgi:hypothetical protein
MAGFKVKATDEYGLSVLQGLVRGRSRVNIRGHDATVPNGGPFGLSPSFGVNNYDFDQSAIAATPAVVGVASSDDTNDAPAGTGALTVRVSGLDANGALQTSDVTMNGQTAVNTGVTFSAVYAVQVLTTGSNNANTGVIWVGTGAFTAGVPAVRMLSMQIGYNISHSGYYVVPAGKTFYAIQFIGTVASSNKDAAVNIETSLDGAQWYTQGPFGLEAGDFTTDVVALPGFAAGTHIQLTAEGGAASTVLTAILAGELVDD